MEREGALIFSECIIDGTFASTKKGLQVGKIKRGKGTKIMAITDSNGVTIAAKIECASPAEVTLVNDTIDVRWEKTLPKRLLGHRDYDCGKFDKETDARDRNDLPEQTRQEK